MKLWFLKVSVLKMECIILTVFLNGFIAFAYGKKNTFYTLSFKVFQYSNEMESNNKCKAFSFSLLCTVLCSRLDIIYVYNWIVRTYFNHIETFVTAHLKASRTKLTHFFEIKNWQKYIYGYTLSILCLTENESFETKIIKFFEYSSF